MTERRYRRAPAASAAVALCAAAALALLITLDKTALDAPPHTSREGRDARRVATCTRIVASANAAARTAADAPPRAVVCLTDGRHNALHLAAPNRIGRVTVRALNPGQATVSKAVLSGSQITLAGFEVREGITVQPGAQGIGIVHNRIVGGYFGVDAGPTTTTSISDTTIHGNSFIGPFGEDAIRLNRYHDSRDPDPFGVLIEANEFSRIRENGNHSDCLQSVWGGDSLYFRRNYLHDNRCQGFFIKDQPQAVTRIVVRNNLMLRNAAPCAPAVPSCGAPAIVHIFGPVKGVQIARNTIWTRGNRSPLVLREGPFQRIVMTRNVIFRAWSDWRDGFPGLIEYGNTLCHWEGTLPRPSRTSRKNCSPHFREPRRDDYRLRGGRGVTWSPTRVHYGP